MKYLMLYEVNLWRLNLKIGDYTIGSENESYASKSSVDYLHNHIGKLIETDRSLRPFCIEYDIEDRDMEKIPAELRWYKSHDNIRWWFRELEFHSSSKEECEAYLAAKKYNI